MNTIRSRTALALMLAIPFQFAVAAAPHGSNATLSVIYELEGSGSFASNDKVLKRNWQVKDRYEVVARLSARKPTGFAALHAPDAAEQQREAARMASAERAATAMAPMMADAMKIMELCGDDEACLTRETLKMSQGVDVNSAAMKGARADVKAASTMPDARYQLFEPTIQTGKYTLDETLKEADRDPICMGRPAATCHKSVVVRASGDITLDGKAEAPAGVALEVDLDKATLRFGLPLPYPVAVDETVSTDKPDQFSGTRETYRFLTNLNLDVEVAHDCGASCSNASGVKTWDVVDQISGQPARLTARWVFQQR